MAALLMLMIGSSLFFLRAQPGDREHVLVTERGVPESDNESVTIVPKKADAPEPSRAMAHPTPSPRVEEAVQRRDRAAEPSSKPRRKCRPPRLVPTRRARARRWLKAVMSKILEGSSEPSTDSDASYDAAMAAYRDGRYSEAQRRFDEIASLGGPHTADAALYGAQARRRVSGCPDAAPRFEAVHARYPGSVGNDAAWQAAHSAIARSESSPAPCRTTIYTHVRPELQEHALARRSPSSTNASLIKSSQRAKPRPRPRPPPQPPKAKPQPPAHRQNQPRAASDPPALCNVNLNEKSNHETERRHALVHASRREAAPQNSREGRSRSSAARPRAGRAEDAYSRMPGTKTSQKSWKTQITRYCQQGADLKG